MLCAEVKLRPSAFAKEVNVDAVAHCMRPGVVPSWEAFNAAVVGFDADQARDEHTRRFAAAAVENTMPKADGSQEIAPSHHRAQES